MAQDDLMYTGSEGWGNSEDDSGGKSTVDKILDFAQGVGLPLARAAIQDSSERQVMQDRQRYNVLNGSGSNDWYNAQNAPHSLMDWAFGTKAGQQAAQIGGLTSGPSGGNPMMLIVFGLAGLIIVILLIRR